MTRASPSLSSSLLCISMSLISLSGVIINSFVAKKDVFYDEKCGENDERVKKMDVTCVYGGSQLMKTADKGRTN